MRIDRTNPWFCVPEKKIEPKFRLFCFPYAGGSAEMYYSWLSKLPDWLQLCAVQLPGRSFRFNELAYNNLDPLVQELAQAFSHFRDLPFAIFGHSLGALIGFELIRQLPIEILKNLKLLFVSARYAPQSQYSMKKIHHLDDQSFVKEVMQLGGIDKDLMDSRSLIEMMIASMRADFKLSETYSYKSTKKLKCPIIGFSGIYDTLLPIKSMQHWQRETSSQFKLYKFFGDHFFLKPFESEVIKIICDHILNEI